MTTARSKQVNSKVTPYYHCVSRCVRRTFLCGFDPLTKRCYEHRRSWIESKIKALTKVYCIDIYAYAIMSNHYHLVVCLNSKKTKDLTDTEVIERWSSLHQQPLLIKRLLNNELKTEADFLKVQNIISEWRERLCNLSWFMKELNWDIAKKANDEDDCKGHFWESRFKSQALMDEKALLAAMAYVDLNPVRAGITETPETSEYTSVKERIECMTTPQITPEHLSPFVGSCSPEGVEGIPFRLLDYLELIDWTGRQLREGKLSIDRTLLPILSRLTADQREWMQVCTKLERKRATLIGRKDSIKRAIPALNRHRVVGYSLS